MRRELTLALALALAACDGGSGDGDADADLDGGSDADAADGGGDAEADADAPIGPPDCPRNSGWPCTCNRSETCDDGSPCATSHLVPSGLGVCAAPCIPGQPPGSACPAHDFPAAAWCQLRESPTGPPTHCLLVCAAETVCPSDQVCVDPDIEGVPGYCLPP